MKFEDNAWLANVAGSGPAVFVTFGQVDVQFKRCLFRCVSLFLDARVHSHASHFECCGLWCSCRDNLAYRSGGAIAVVGPAALIMSIHESTFDSNAVRPPPDVGSVDVTVRVNTVRASYGWQFLYLVALAAANTKCHCPCQGSFVIDPDAVSDDLDAIGQMVPVWRIDDGPVYGTTWEMSQRAKESSLAAVSKGYPASWPTDLPNANISYSGPAMPYNHIVSLAPGTHTLWTGLMVQVRLNPLSFPCGLSGYDPALCSVDHASAWLGASMDRLD